MSQGEAGQADYWQDYVALGVVPLLGTPVLLYLQIHTAEERDTEWEDLVPLTQQHGERLLRPDDPLVGEVRVGVAAQRVRPQPVPDGLDLGLVQHLARGRAAQVRPVGLAGHAHADLADGQQDRQR